MIIHVLPGDAQVEEFGKTGLEGEVVVCREAFIDGDVRASTLTQLWQVREQFWTADHPDVSGSYRERTVDELEKLLELPDGSTVNLWFEYELFCHVNMWFSTWLLKDSRATIYRVAPVTLQENEIWNGFGRMAADDLKRCYAERAKFGDGDIRLGANLWDAYRERDHRKLRELSTTVSPCFPYLKEACEAEIDKEFRPKQILHDLRKSGVDDFGKIFAAFRQQAGVYGFGDTQVRRILEDS